MKTFIICVYFCIYNASNAIACVEKGNAGSLIDDFEEVCFFNRIYYRDNLIDLFINSIITRSIYNDYIIDNPNIVSFWNARVLINKNNYPWLYNNIVFEDRLPSPLAVDKWTRPIRISFGMPYDMKPFDAPLINGKRATDYETWPIVGKKDVGPPRRFNQTNQERTQFEDFPRIKNFVVEFAEELSNILPIPISFHEFSNDTPRYYGNIRINFFDEDDYPRSSYVKFKNFFKRKFDESLVFYEFRQAYPSNIDFFDRGYEKLFQSPRHFTNNGVHGISKNQVDGYFLVNSKNEINLAICHIWNRHETNLKILLTKECIIRALGFPDIFSVEGSTLFEWGRNEHKLKTYIEAIGSNQQLSDFDTFIIRTLYHSHLKPGMNFSELQSVFERTGSQNITVDR